MAYKVFFLTVFKHLFLHRSTPAEALVDEAEERERISIFSEISTLTRTGKKLLYDFYEK